MLCEDPGHRTLQAFSGIVVAVIAFGLPVLFDVVLIRSARSYEREFAVPKEEVAKRLAKEMNVDVTVAGYVIRDITIGRDYSFLMVSTHNRSLIKGLWCCLQILPNL